MAFFDKVAIDGTSYDVKDSQAAQDIQTLTASLNTVNETVEQHGNDIEKLQDDIANLDVSTLKTVFDVTEYGADNTGTNYSDTAVSTIMSNNPCGIIFFPAGIYRFKNPITVNKPFKFLGVYAYGNYAKENSYGSRLRFDTHGFIVQIGGCQICNLAMFWGADSSGASDTYVGIDIQNAVSAESVAINLFFQNLYIQDFRFGISSEAATVFMSTFINIWVNGGDTAFRFRTTGNATSLTFIGCWGTWQTNVTWNLNRVYYSTLISCGSDNSQFGYAIDNCLKLSMIACGVESVTGTTVPAARFESTNTSHIELMGASITKATSFIQLSSCMGVQLDIYCNDTMATSVTDDSTAAARNSMIGYCRGTVTVSGVTFTPDGFVRYVTTSQA